MSGGGRPLKAVNLYFLTRIRNQDCYTEYENVLSGRRQPQKVREHEFENLIHLAEKLRAAGIPVSEMDGFYYSYTIGQIGKEFDLLKICPNRRVLNIELKSIAVPEAKIAKQLRKNQYYLSCLAPALRLFTYVDETDCFYTLEGDRLRRCETGELAREMHSFGDYVTGEIDVLFQAKDYLISPINDPEKFLSGRYFLTQQQEGIRKELLTDIRARKQVYYQGITGDSGTGKTLLLYDLAAECAKRERCTILHFGPLTEGHRQLRELHWDVDVIEGKNLSEEILRYYTCLFADEAQRIRESDLQAILAAAERNRAACIFSYDYFQTLSKTEQRFNIPGRLSRLPGYQEHKLSGRIRSNREVGSFIRTLLNLKDHPARRYDYSDIDLLYAADQKEAEEILRYYTEQNYVYIALERTERDQRFLDLCRRGYYAEEVIGQEFAQVLILLDDKFYYNEDGKLRGRRHANPDYISSRIFFQAASRTREKLCVAVLGNEEVFGKLLAEKYRNL